MLNTSKIFSPALRLIVLCIVFVFICSSLPDTIYHRLVSLTFLLKRFARMTSRKPSIMARREVVCLFARIGHMGGCPLT